MKLTLAFVSLQLIIVSVFAQTKAPVKTPATKAPAKATTIVCKLRCKAEFTTDVDVFYTYKEKKSVLIKANKPYKTILLCGENKIEIEDANKSKLTKIITVSDTMPKKITVEYLGKDKFIEYVRENNVAMLELSLKKHPELADNRSDELDVHPVTVATERGNVAALKLLLDKGARINPPAEFNPIHSAIINNKYDVFKLLLERKGNINAKDPQNWTPLHFAVKYNRTQYIKDLIAAGAKLNERNNDGDTPYKMALETAQLTIADELKGKGAIE
jgi:hypothetical protein